MGHNQSAYLYDREMPKCRRDIETKHFVYQRNWRHTYTHKLTDESLNQSKWVTTTQQVENNSIDWTEHKSELSNHKVYSI